MYYAVENSTVTPSSSSEMFSTFMFGNAVSGAARKLEALYEVPYLAHATMEPLNCTVKIDGDRCEIWTGTSPVCQLSPAWNPSNRKNS